MLVSAGPTYEDIDPVRYLGNRSSGRMGFALASEARQRGARVTLVAGPTRIEPPAVDEVVRVRSAAEMHDAMMAAASSADVVIMAAAVADFTPASTATGKVAKAEGPMTLTLNRTRDILGDLGARRAAIGAVGPVLVGFAAETDDLLRKAREKRARKGVDMIVANDVSLPDRGFDVDDQRRDDSQRRRRRINLAAEQGSGRGGHSRSRRASVADPHVDAGAPLNTVNDDLRAHLEFFKELGVDGIRLEPAWRIAASARHRCRRSCSLNCRARALEPEESVEATGPPPPVPLNPLSPCRCFHRPPRRSTPCVQRSVLIVSAASCTHSAASRWSSASEIPTPT